MLKFILLCLVCGVIVGCLIFLFKITASAVISLSNDIYHQARNNILLAPFLVIGAAILGYVASIILKYAPDGKGGGIPTAISVLRGLVSFSWIKSIFSMFTSAMLTFLVGVPLGNEGPSVQMGTSVGRGCIRIIAKDHQAWDRYIMTGGACAGFAAATGAPLAGIFFAFEEAHRRFSPMIFTASAMTAVTANCVMKLLCELTNTHYSIFTFHTASELPMKYIWISVVVGIVCGALAILLTKFYRIIRKLLLGKFSCIPFALKITAIFMTASILGLISEKFRGSGHDIVEQLVEEQGIWYLFLLCIVVRAVLLLFSNNIGVTGGLFVPTLAFGAISGGLVGNVLTSLGLLPVEYYSVAVIIGISSVLASFSRTPIMAIAFSFEALGAVNNILPIILGVTVAYVIVERFEILPFTDVVIEAKTEDANKGKEAAFIDVELVVSESAFIVGKEIRDVLWPPSCVVTSVHKHQHLIHNQGNIIAVGDILTFHFKSYDVEKTMSVLEAFVGKQSVRINDIHLPTDPEDEIPEL